MHRVLVVMSTYNGEKYVKEQIISILNQKNVDVHLLIRDDGSTDHTVDMIKQLNDDRISIMEEKNIGCEFSFFELLKCCRDYDYFAFSDQDDYWEEDKLISGIKHMEKESGPALAACNLVVCDETLNPIRKMFSEESIEKLNSQMKRDIVLRNIHGCVLVWNNSLNLLLQKSMPHCKVAHDVWVNAVANLVAKVWIDPVPHIKYRLHGNNVSGLALSPLQRMKKGIQLYLGRNHLQMDCVAEELLNVYADLLDGEDQGMRTLMCIRDYKKGIKQKLLLMKQPIICDRKLSDALFWQLCVLINKF